MSETESTALRRREFGRIVTAGLSGTALGFVSGEALAQEAKPDEPPRPPSLATLMLAAVVTECPGDHWDDEMLQNVLSDIRGDQARSRQLSAYPLKNGDDPATVFVAPALPHAGGSR